jgi:hypothetical protein
LAGLTKPLRREGEFPKLKTEAYLALPYFIAVHSIEDRYDLALELLAKHESRLMFPVDHFRWHAARALTLGARGEETVASGHARRALDAASREQSGFKNHPHVGLVTELYSEVLQKLRGYSDA